MARLKPAAFLALLAVAGAGTAALAAGGGARTSTVTVGAFDRGAATARCRESRHPSLIGVKAATGPQHGLVISGLRPQGRRAVRAAGANVFVNPAPLTATAYCSAGVESRVVSKTRVLAPSKAGRPGRGKVTASCPAGESVQLAGYRGSVSPQPQGPSVLVNLMRRAGRRRVVVGGVNRGTAKGRLRAIAACGRGGSLDARHAGAKLPRSGGASAATARCPRGERVVFGGFRMRSSNGAGPYLRSLARPDPRRWRVAAFQFERPHGTLTAIAYCGR